MIYQPIDCIPYLSAVDIANAENGDFKFKVSGGKMVAYQYIFYDFYNDNEPIVINKVSTASNPVYGGLGEDSVVTPDVTNIKTSLSNGHDYKYKIRLWESIDSTKPTPSNWITYGRIVESDNPSVTKFDIRAHLNIPNGSYGGLDVQYFLKLNGLFYKISKYELEQSDTPTYGTVTLSSGVPSTPIAGTRYEIYADFVDSGEYYFYARSNPSLTIPSSGIGSSAAINITGIYSQDEGVQISYYKCVLRDDTTDKTVDETAEIFSELVKYTFMGLLNGHRYTLIISGETQLGSEFNTSVTFNVSYTSAISFVSPTVVYNKELHCATINLSEFLTAKGELLNNNYRFEDITLTDGTVSKCLALDKGNACSYSKLNLYKDFTLPDDYTIIFQVKLDSNFEGVVFSSNDNIGCTIEFKNHKFYYRFLRGTSGEYNPYINGESPLMIQEDTPDPKVLYLWNSDMETAEFDDEYYWTENNVLDNYYYMIVIRGSSIGASTVNIFPLEVSESE